MDIKLITQSLINVKKNSDIKRDSKTYSIKFDINFSVPYQLYIEK